MKKSKLAQAPAPQCVDLPVRVSIAQSIELHRTLAACLASGAPVSIDGGRVEQIDTAILQLLVSTWLGARKRGTECRWQGASQALRRAAALIGVADVLQLDAPPAA